MLGLKAKHNNNHNSNSNNNYSNNVFKDDDDDENKNNHNDDIKKQMKNKTRIRGFGSHGSRRGRGAHGVHRGQMGPRLLDWEPREASGGVLLGVEGSRKNFGWLLWVGLSRWNSFLLA